MSLFSGTDLFLNKRLLFFLFLCSARQPGQAAISHILQHNSALSVHATVQYKATFTLKFGRSLGAAAAIPIFNNKTKWVCQLCRAQLQRGYYRCCFEGLWTVSLKNNIITEGWMDAAVVFTVTADAFCWHNNIQYNQFHASKSDQILHTTLGQWVVFTQLYLSFYEFNQKSQDYTLLGENIRVLLYLCWTYLQLSCSALSKQ